MDYIFEDNRFSTQLDDDEHFNSSNLAMLAHKVRDPLGRAYNRTKHLPERRKMMQTWPDYLDGLKPGRR